MKTTTGNSENPTLNKREIQTALSVADGEMVVLGGLTDNKEEKAKSGLFGWNFSSSDSDSKSELMLLLQVERI
ncbi:Bacterial type II and III secretion system protein [compost metagenome]